ncbi:MAG: hypothetical protein JXN63_06590 [Candidatus Delongbacteria bacterium]|nr:hypothetical protein [Candidatus Delongbacteria bacterium]
MRAKYLFFFIVLYLSTAFSAQIVMTGFKDDDPKTEFITEAMVKYIRANLEEAGLELMDDKVEGLDLNVMRTGNFFLASKDYFEGYENIDLDYSLTGNVSFRGRNINVFIEMYSRGKKRLVIKSDFKGKAQSLLAFYHHITNEILRAAEVAHEVKNIFPVDDEAYFYRYIRYSYELDQLFQYDVPEKYYALMDELNSMKDEFEEFPAFAEMYDELVTMTEDYEKTGPYELPMENVSSDISSGDDEIQKFARDLIVNGYEFYYRKTNKTADEDDPSILDLVVEFDVKMKKSAYKSLMDEIKTRKGNTRFINMGRYFISENEKENEIFTKFLLNQTVELRFIDEDGLVIAASEYFINKRQYSNGAYRNAEVLPMPLTPRGPAYPAFGLKSSSKIGIEFKDIKESEIGKAVKTEILIKFE